MILSCISSSYFPLLLESGQTWSISTTGGGTTFFHQALVVKMLDRAE